MPKEAEHSKETNVKSTIDAVKGLVEAVPVYNDVVQPAAQEMGKSLTTVAKTVNIALAPISALVWGFEKIQEYIIRRVSEKLKDVPEQKIVTPDPAIVGPSLEALRYAGNDVNLRELYANLIAAAMNVDQIATVHPGFVEIIKNLSSEEALLMRYFFQSILIGDSHPLIDIKVSIPSQKGSRVLLTNFSIIGNLAKLKYPNQVPIYINNLCRLGLMQIPPGQRLINDELYKPLKNLIELDSYRKEYEHFKGVVTTEEKLIQITDLGKLFGHTCIGFEPLVIDLPNQ
jgi:hypothetical protein